MKQKTILVETLSPFSRAFLIFPFTLSFRGLYVSLWLQVCQAAEAAGSKSQDMIYPTKPSSSPPPWGFRAPSAPPFSLQLRTSENGFVPSVSLWSTEQEIQKDQQRNYGKEEKSFQGRPGSSHCRDGARLKGEDIQALHRKLNERFSGLRAAQRNRKLPNLPDLEPWKQTVPRLRSRMLGVKLLT